MENQIWSEEVTDYGFNQYVVWGFVGSVLLLCSTLASIAAQMAMISIASFYTWEYWPVLVASRSLLNFAGIITFSIGMYGLHQRYESQIMLYACVVYLISYLAMNVIYLAIMIDFLILAQVIGMASAIILGCSFLSIRDEASSPSLVGGFGAFQVIWTVLPGIYVFIPYGEAIILINLTGIFILAALRVAALASEWKQHNRIVLYD